MLITSIHFNEIPAEKFATFADACAAGETLNKTIVVSTNMAVSASLVVENRAVRIANHGLTIAAGQTLTINGPFQAGLSQCFFGDGSVVFGAGAVTEVYPEWWGTIGTVVKAITSSQANAKVKLQGCSYTEPLGLINTVRGLVVEGVFGDRSTVSGSQIIFTGAGTFFQNGSDNGHSWDDADYDGPQGISFRNICFTHGAPDTACVGSGGAYMYKSGSYAIADWRGGDIRLDNVTFEYFDYGFWGVQSDVNRLSNIQIRGCNIGIYAGPRSDQLVLDGLYATLSNQAVVLDRVQGTRMYSPQIVGCGTDVIYPIEIRKGCSNITLYSPWFEHYQGYSGVDQVGFISGGLVNGYNTTTASATGITVINPLIATTSAGAAYHTLALVGLGAANAIKVQNPVATMGTSLTNLSYLVESPAGTSFNNALSTCVVEGLTTGLTDAQIYANNGTGSPHIEAYREGSSGTSISNPTGRLSIKRFNGAAGVDEIRLGNEGSAGFLYAIAPTYTGGQTNRLKLWKSLQQSTAMPTSGTWQSGDFVWNIVPTELGVTGSKYIILGWNRMTNGSSHVINTDWKELRCLTGV